MGLHLTEGGAELELGIPLARAAQGRGLWQVAMRGVASPVGAATEAQRIVVSTDARNVAALRLIARLGLPLVDMPHETGRPEPVFHWTRPPSDVVSFPIAPDRSR
ncbi:Acetyltransferase (GNAT) domain-containing protein [Jannaschia seohaensis]|uniref:Acetyltransferase (GNAT) domain-containing protein n=1 Tax=Jannaschia seohaensis TaxID=475081 RepID=A0A2Y9AYB0_9RHOB|nr:acetyltransferase (GNAT) family protein [Jannaschia seohaensis]SSA48268.1 Acetyltransferase (GNAT) domain-containing protein [Jannaschia seohaensis]